VPLETARSFCRYGQRDERRRRLLTDDLSGPDDRWTCRIRSEDSLSPSKSEHYGNAEFLERSLRLFDLVPRRWIVLLGWWAAAMTIMAGLGAAYIWMRQQATVGGHAVIAALDIAARGSLAGWFSSLVLLAAAVMALLIYAVRRHRTDDYQGRYRIWLWAAGCWLFLAADRAAGLSEGMRDGVAILTGTSWLDDGALWWAVVYILLLGSFGSRLWIDMHSNRTALVVLVMAAVAYGLTIAGRLGWFLNLNLNGTDAGPRDVLLRVGCAMVGDLLLLTAMSLHARHVLLDAEGLLPRPGRKAEEPQDKPSETTKNIVEEPKKTFWGKIDPPHVLPQPSHQQAVRPATVSVASPTPAAATASATAPSSLSPAPVNRKLTKAERKALKERLLRERQERERRR